jgi:transcription elongation factor Elf1
VRQQLQGNANVDFHDRFSDAVKEEAEKSAFTCESCGHHQIVNKE